VSAVPLAARGVPQERGRAGGDARDRAVTVAIAVACAWVVFLIAATYAARLRARHQARLNEAFRWRGPMYPTGRSGEGWIRLDWPAEAWGDPPITYEHAQFRWTEVIESDGYRWGRFG
jgi:hypothetical protein